MAKVMFLITLWVYPLLFSLLWTNVLGGCPNNCNGRGVCNPEGQCICEEPYVAAPDCSLSNRNHFFMIIGVNNIFRILPKWPIMGWKTVCAKFCAYPC